MTKEQKKNIAEILERRGVAVGYLFGSAARGTMGPHSDVDVAVVFDEGKIPAERQFDEKTAISSELAEAFKVEDADVINLFTTADPVIRYSAVFSGELILNSDNKVRLAVEHKIVRDYEDTRELRRIARVITRNQINDGSFGRAQASK